MDVHALFSRSELHFFLASVPHPLAILASILYHGEQTNIRLIRTYNTIFILLSVIPASGS